jgi:hypothetical protein
MSRGRWSALAVVMLVRAVVLALVGDGLALGAVIMAAVAVMNMDTT